MSSIKDMAARVWDARISPPSRKMVALCLAELHDDNGGCIAVAMATLADRSGLSLRQAQRCVHALITDGVVEVIAHATGGEAGSVPRYRFSTDKLQAMTVDSGGTPDLFPSGHGAAQAEPCVGEHQYQFQQGEHVLEASLVGGPGHRSIQFRHLGRKGMPYGAVALSALLRSPGGFRGWHGGLRPTDHLDCPEDERIALDPAVILEIAQWAQGAALGRVESMAEA